VLQTYSRSVDIYGRYLVFLLKKILKIENVIWKIPSKRTSKDQKPKIRTLSGFISPQVQFSEGKLEFKVNILEGQKSGLFLDLRGLRKYLSQLDLKNKKVLNLFSYTRTLGLACEVAGAKKITQVDISEGALNYSKKHHTKDASKHEFIKADIFEYLKEIDQKFDLIIVDPPQMTSKKEQIPTVLKAYQSLYGNSSRLLTDGGMVIACCCTGKLSRETFEKETRRYLSQYKIEKKIAPEDDHPVGFAEGDYLKVIVYKRGLYRFKPDT
jgi:23S rRNA (cytosine1962-C5)-methyltransferase